MSTKPIQQTFCPWGLTPYETVPWETRTAELKDHQGNIVFRQEGVRFPDFWSPLAVSIVASKYFRGTPGTPEREYSLQQMVSRVVDTIARWGFDGSYYSVDETWALAKDLAWLILHQRLSFNSPVWFNVGAPGVERPPSPRRVLSWMSKTICLRF